MGKIFKYAVTRVRGTGPDDLQLREEAAETVAQTIQANLLHIPHSQELAGLCARRAHVLGGNKPTRDITKLAGWDEIKDIPDLKLLRLFPARAIKQARFS